MTTAAPMPAVAAAMNRSAALPLVATLAVAGLVGLSSCGSDGGDAFDTLPPIRTTTTTTTTTIPLDERIKLYVVKEGENLSMIAAAFEVPLDTLIDYNSDKIGDPNNVQPGTTLEIPPFILFDELPTPSSTEAPPP